MYQKILVMFLLIFLLSPSFTMSGDGNVPVVQKENVPDVVSQADQQPVSNPDSNENEIVKDRLGIDTGMTKKEFDEFKTQYFTVAKNLGITSDIWIDIQSYFDHKINLNAVEELKNNGFFWTSDPKHGQRIEYSISHSDIILIGTIESVEYLYNTQEEEWNARTTSKLSRYYVKVENLLKGAEYYNSIPNQVSYTSPIGNFVTATSDHKLEIGQKYILFFRKYASTDNDLYKIRYTSLRLEGSDLYLESSKTKLNVNPSKLISMINKFQEINDTKNFYNRHYIDEEE